MASNSAMIKQIASSRRKPGMTRREYLDYHFRVHGALADDIDDRNAKPEKYLQTHVFDSVYGARPGPVPNANHAWMARDDVTELYFRDWDHVQAVMNSSYVREKIGPDGKNFADFETAMVLLAHEHEVPLGTEAGADTADDSAVRHVAMFFVAAPDGSLDGVALDAQLTPLLVAALQAMALPDVRGLLVNVGFTSEKFDLTTYFGGKDMPRYAVVYKIVMRSAASVRTVRRAQAAFAKQAAGLFDDSVSYTLFGYEGLIFDASQGIKLANP
ncbi:hypothetical protein Sste5346_000503 [Sporothrix stenoceras]|uniref:EthD domain-containing protein n=1 Tax=Sporothrix stenoceras TaxID=5173 RepID=A0ABR3ZR97_9PEZI